VAFIGCFAGVLHDGRSGVTNFILMCRITFACGVCHSTSVLLAVGHPTLNPRLSAMHYETMVRIMFLLFLNLRCKAREGLFTHPSAAPLRRRFLVARDETVTMGPRFPFRNGHTPQACRQGVADGLSTIPRVAIALLGSRRRI
jgi:hypothetical protein